MKFSKNLSLFVLLATGLILSLYRITNVNEKEISWDVLGYYLPLPATFIYHDPMLDKTDWIRKINDERNLSGTLYQVSETDDGKPLYFFLFGMALLYLPFFFAGHFFAFLLKIPADGFTLPYQYAMVIGAIIYTLIGLIFLRKNLKRFFSERVTALVMLIIVFSTNYIHHLTLKDLETVNVLFMLVNIIIWYTIRWHEVQKLKYLLAVGAGIILMALVKPSEILIVLIPLLWNISSRESLKEKIRLIRTNWKQIVITLILCFIIVLPQLLYWRIKTGSFIYDSYKNPGIGLDLSSPHILDVLISYRKGWLIYTPVMAFSLIGFYFLFRNNRKIFLSLFGYFLVAFCIIASWTEWWYGAAFSMRPLITVYPILAISLGYFLVYLGKKGIIMKSVFIVIVILFTFLNQFQWWQLKHYILDPYRTTKGFYWATFLKTSVTDEEKKLLLIGHDFTGKMSFDNRTDYHSVLAQELAFDEPGNPEGVVQDGEGNKYYSVGKDQEYVLTRQFKYSELTVKDHIWVVVSLDVFFPTTSGNGPCLVTTMEHNGKSYAYSAPEIKPDTARMQWKKYSFEYLTPEIRKSSDILKIYIWNRNKESFDVDNFKLEVFEKNGD
ncbi:MAG: glycosyltransferase family 39 protein [Bacteroidetes bacterium]|nr:glycosyltransferase family 39 protein [Bacteroidota bacterium]